MLRYIDSLLDRVTMYRLLLYYLIVLVGAAAALSQLGYLHYSPFAVIFSALYLVGVCWASNFVFAYVFDAPTNRESSILTALILTLIISPVSTPHGVLFLTAAGGLAMASKYMLAIAKRHVFNPAAIAVVLTGLGAGQTASWWVGSAPLLPFVLVGGVLMMRKVRRAQMIFSFVLSTYIASIIYTALAHGDLGATLQKTTLSTALFFLAFVMLTEPMTSPRVVKKQRWYGVLAGLLFPPQVHLASLYTTPELVLIVGNLFSYIVGPPVKVFPGLLQKIKLAPGLMDFVFTPKQRFSYEPGQYMELTLPHEHPDSRGDRRYFTLASSPTEPDIHFGVRFYPKGSSYKKAMLAMSSTTKTVASQLGGDFTLPKDKTRKLAFIAGGIGVTPYRSMLKYLIDTGEHRNITMLYAAGSAAELVYTDVFEMARQQMNAQIVYCLTSPGTETPKNHYIHAPITASLVSQQIPDYQERLFFVAGSHGMVNDVTDALRAIGVSSTNIKVDLFPGYAN